MASRRQIMWILTFPSMNLLRNGSTFSTSVTVSRFPPTVPPILSPRSIVPCCSRLFVKEGAGRMSTTSISFCRHTISTRISWCRFTGALLKNAVHAVSILTTILLMTLKSGTGPELNGNPLRWKRALFPNLAHVLKTYASSIGHCHGKVVDVRVSKQIEQTTCILGIRHNPGSKPFTSRWGALSERMQTPPATLSFRLPPAKVGHGTGYGVFSTADSG